MRKEVYFLLIWIIISNVLVIVDGQVEEDIESISVIFVDGVVGQVPKDVGIYEFLREPFLDDGLPDRAMLYSELGLSYGGETYNLVVLECIGQCGIEKGEINREIEMNTIKGTIDGVTEISDSILFDESNDPWIFIRGDANDDRVVDISDVVFILSFLFKDGEGPKIIDSIDVNDDRVVDLSDVINLLGFLYRGDNQPGAPYPNLGFEENLISRIPYSFTLNDEDLMFEYQAVSVSVLGDIDANGILNNEDISMLEQKVDDIDLDVSCASAANLILAENGEEILNSEDINALADYTFMNGNTYYLDHKYKFDCEFTGFPISTRLSGFPGESTPIIIHGGGALRIKSIDAIHEDVQLRIDERKGNVIFADIGEDAEPGSSVLVLFTTEDNVHYYLHIYINDFLEDGLINIAEEIEEPEGGGAAPPPVPDDPVVSSSTCPYEENGCCAMIVNFFTDTRDKVKKIDQEVLSIIDSLSSLECDVSKFIAKKDVPEFDNSNRCTKEVEVVETEGIDDFDLVVKKICVAWEFKSDVKKRKDNWRLNNLRNLRSKKDDYYECTFLNSNLGVESAVELVVGHGSYGTSGRKIAGYWDASDLFGGNIGRYDFWKESYDYAKACNHLTADGSCYSGNSPWLWKIFENMGNPLKAPTLIRPSPTNYPTEESYNIANRKYDEQKKVVAKWLEDLSHSSGNHLGWRSNINFADNKKISLSCYEFIEDMVNYIDINVKKAKSDGNVKVNKYICEDKLNWPKRVNYYYNDGVTEVARGCKEEENECWCGENYFID